MENRSKIEIIQTGIGSAKVLVNGKELKPVTGYKIEHNANSIARLELIMGKPLTDVTVDEICEVSIRYAEDKENAD